MKHGFGNSDSEMLHQLTQGLFWFRGQTCTVVNFWVVTDHSVPENHQCLLNCEIPLFLLSIYVLLGFGN